MTALRILRAILAVAGFIVLLGAFGALAALLQYRYERRKERRNGE